ncbi:MAG: hypothetical protein WC868_11365 [Bacteroidales bacterium]
MINDRDLKHTGNFGLLSPTVDFVVLNGGYGNFQGINVDTYTIARVYGNYDNSVKVYCPAYNTTFYTINY